jgi:hypothetical protein
LFFFAISISIFLNYLAIASAYITPITLAFIVLSHL